MKDNQGRAYAKFTDVNEGAFLEMDGGLDCMKAGEVKKVKAWGSSKDRNDLYVTCIEGYHFLQGQLHDGYLVGMYFATEGDRQ